VAGGVLLGPEGATTALVLGAAFAALGCVMSSLRLLVGAK
jgi:DHA2 family multidrug resistance protein-like MFS transporter